MRPSSHRSALRHRPCPWAPALALTLVLALTLPAAGIIALAPIHGDVLAQASSAFGADWEQLPLDGRVSRAFPFPDGALYAVRTAPASGTVELQRSDDDGATWRPLALPGASPGRGDPFPDPQEPRVWLAGGAGGIYRTGDGSDTWQLVLPFGSDSRYLARGQVSPADPNLVYAAIAAGTPAIELEDVRSRDAGATWQTLARHGAPSGGSCPWTSRIFQPHPTDPDRVFRAADCIASREWTLPTTTSPLSESRDRGATWTERFRPPQAAAQRLVGGAGTSPLRWYLATLQPIPGGASRVYRSDDDGATWAEVLAVRARSGVNTLAYDPATPDRVFVGLGPDEPGIQASADGGATWQALGAAELRGVADLAVSPDSRYLYAATQNGLWRRLLDP